MDLGLESNCNNPYYVNGRKEMTSQCDLWFTIHGIHFQTMSDNYTLPFGLYFIMFNQLNSDLKRRTMRVYLRMVKAFCNYDTTAPKN